jgi:hypothetical protein
VFLLSLSLKLSDSTLTTSKTRAIVPAASSAEAAEATATTAGQDWQEEEEEGRAQHHQERQGRVAQVNVSARVREAEINDGNLFFIIHFIVLQPKKLFIRQETTV